MKSIPLERGAVYKYMGLWFSWAGGPGLRYKYFASWEEAYDYAHTNTPIPMKVK